MNFNEKLENILKQSVNAFAIDFPFKDCVLEGGQSKELNKSFYNIKKGH
jgi:hypothetical protein